MDAGKADRPAPLVASHERILLYHAPKRQLGQAAAAALGDGFDVAGAITCA